MTTAQKISRRFNNDGRCFKDCDGYYLTEILEDTSVREDWRDGYRTGDTVRYTFMDDSVITVAGDAWDLGYPSCYCWQSCPNEDCENH
jgi:hypothetical protein